MNNSQLSVRKTATGQTRLLHYNDLPGRSQVNKALSLGITRDQLKGLGKREISDLIDSKLTEPMRDEYPIGTTISFTGYEGGPVKQGTIVGYYKNANVLRVETGELNSRKTNKQYAVGINTRLVAVLSKP